MVKLIEMMLDEGLVTKEAISKLVKSRPQRRSLLQTLLQKR